MKLETTKELKLNVLVRHDADRGVFVGQCLQYDVAVQAPSMDKLKTRFAHAFAAYFVELTKNSNGAPKIRPAPRAFWDLYLTGLVNDNDLPIYVAAEREVRATFAVTKGASPVLLEASPA